MSEQHALRKHLKEFGRELQKSRREAERAWAMTYGVLYKGEFSFASMKMTGGALSLLGNKLSKIGMALALSAELLALEKGKTSIDKRIMKKVLDQLEKEDE